MRIRIISLAIFFVLAAVSVFFVFRIQFSFDFEQFFPEGDEDLELFREFTEEFETDDNFMLVAVKREDGVFQQDFLERFHEMTLAARELPYILESQSLTKFSYPIKTPFAITTIPAIHIDQPERYENDKKRILNDERFVYNLINEDATALVLYLKTKDGIGINEARELMNALDQLVSEKGFENIHYLGRAYFQKELVQMQIREVTVSAIVSAILVSLIMFFIFRRPIGIIIALVSIGLGMLLFMGLLGAMGRELNAMAALYPVLMIIVGTSDVIHIMSKYIDELRKGFDKKEAIITTIKEIGLATLLTSITTAIGFASLLSSRVGPIRDFGINAAMGVLVAYVTVIGFTTALLSFFDKDKIIKFGRGQAFWEKSMEWSYQFTLKNPRRIAVAALVTLGICFLGISMITTNYSINNNLPINRQITADFAYFEEELAGFRPLEFAVYAQDDYTVGDYEVVKEINKVEERLRDIPSIKAIGSIASIYKSIGQMYGNNNPEAFAFPDNEREFERYKRVLERLPENNLSVLVSKDQKKARITSRVFDIGADTIKMMGLRLDDWFVANTDTSVVQIERTGTGLLLDKNAEYIRRSLILGLGMAVLIVSILMALLFRNIKMLLISLLPNIFPLLLAGALLGFLGIELEAGISIVFAVIFGIAVDDTIHFLSKFKLARNKGYDIEKSLHITFLETGKAIVLTSIILFFGFLVMLFSIHPPSITIGLLISLTLFSALISDLLLIPLLIRWLMKEEATVEVEQVEELEHP